MEQFDEDRTQQDEQKNGEQGRKPTQVQLSLRIIVGGYLYYLIYQLITGGALNYSGWHLAAMIGGIVLFAGFGGYFIVKSLLDIIRHNYQDPNA